MAHTALFLFVDATIAMAAYWAREQADVQALRRVAIGIFWLFSLLAASNLLLLLITALRLEVQVLIDFTRATTRAFVM